MPIVSYPGAGYYPPFVRDIINAAWDLGNAKYDLMEEKITTLTDPLTGWLATTAAPQVTASPITPATVAEPAVTIPTAIDVSDILTTFGTQYGDLVMLLGDKFASLIATYYPNDAAEFAAAEAWLTAALASDTGLPPAVAAQLMTDERDRIVAEASRASDSLIQRFAAMRFQRPLTSGLAQIQQKAQNDIAAASRKITIGSVEQLRWVVEQMLKKRQMAMDEALSYMQAIAAGPKIAADVTGLGYSEQGKLITAVSAFYNARTDAVKVTAQGEQFNATLDMDAKGKNQSAAMAMIEYRVKALIGEIQTLAQLATSLFNNIHASAGVTASDSVNTSI